MVKTLEQINREFMEENKLTKTETPQIDFYGDMARQLAEMDTYLNSVTLNDPDIKEADALLNAAGIIVPSAKHANDNPEPPAYTPVADVLARFRQAEEKKRKRRRNILKRATDILLYTAVVFILVAVIILSGASNRGFNLFGYSGFTVLSDSMQSEIPEGSFVLVKKIDPGNINVGDDITFIRRKDNSAVTHRVVNIYESYGESGGIGFRTQGVDNADPDQDIVYADDIVGIVKLTVPGLGSVLNYISVNVGIILVAMGALFLIAVLIKKFTLPGKKTCI